MKLDASKFRRLRLVITCDPQKELSRMLQRCKAAQFLMETVFGVTHEWNNPVVGCTLDLENGYVLRDSPKFIPVIGEQLRWKLNIDEHHNLSQILTLQDGLKNNKTGIFANPIVAPDIDDEETGMPVGKLYLLEIKQKCRSSRLMWAIRNSNFPLLKEKMEKVLLPGMGKRMVSV